MADSHHEPMIAADEEAYASYADSRSRRDATQRNLWIALFAVGTLAVVATAVAISAHTGGASSNTELEQVRRELTAAQIERGASKMTESTGVMLMSQPVCRQSRLGYLACIDLVNAAAGLITDLQNASLATEKIMDGIKAGTYNIGNTVPFASYHDDAVEIMGKSLTGALSDSSISLTAGNLADLTKCDYVWRGVACLTMVQVKKSAECDDPATASEQCKLTVVPVIHILDSASVDHASDGTVRRRSADKVIVSVAGGIPDLRKNSRQYSGDRRRGIGGDCYSGVGERLLCHCNSRGCGYLDYYIDPEGRWGGGI